MGFAKAHPIAAAGNKEKGARNTHQWDSLKRIPSLPRAKKEKSARNTHQWDSLKRIPSLPRAKKGKGHPLNASVGFAKAHPIAAAGILCNKSKGRILQINLSILPFDLLRKEWDSNPRYTKKRTPDFESGPFDHSGIFPLLQQCKCNKKKQHKNKKLFKFISLKFI